MKTLHEISVSYTKNETARPVVEATAGPNRNASVLGDAHGC
jgi:hypothetical protein